MTGELIRRVILKPYRKGYGPTFTLKLYYRGTEKLGYELFEGREIIFSGTEYRPSPLHAIDSDESVAGLMEFLTLRPGDTDAEYFDEYTKRQLVFAATHGEILGAEVMNRFGEY